ncbi:hypothetical protein [Photobacterium kishitanii]|uniref:Radical SAM protein n=1 Tax=Photobacterium kishitanii TaxID=318456 RepID=A0A2T3KLX2_9GAMM|nr:hypothetical protein [Photobacterium kishitanii]PSV00667.1 hypothetical protein C9J27_05880 [Photobacterium kishitanii]
MNKPIDIAFSILTNTSCTLRCKHCYQTKEEFNSKEFITKETVLSILDRVEDFCIRNPNGRRYGYEILGGETFLLPIEFWEWLFPELNARLLKIEKITGVESTMCIYTNLMYKDERYTKFIKERNDDNRISFSTSWEVGTSRFGSKNQLIEKWKKRVSDSGMEAVHVVLTNGIVEMGAKAAYDFLVNDVKFKSVTFEPFTPTENSSSHAIERPSFSDESKFMREFFELNNHSSEPVELSPHDEITASLCNGFSTLCDGTEKYYASFLPNGDLHNMTIASQGELCGVVSDKNQNEKLIWTATENLVDEVLIAHEKCHGCEYLRYCHSGYNVSNALSAQDIDEQNKKGDCHGHKLLWDTVAKFHDVRPFKAQAVLFSDFLNENKRFWRAPKPQKHLKATSTILALSKDHYIDAVVEAQNTIDGFFINELDFISLPRKILFFDDMKAPSVQIETKTLIDSGFSLEIVEAYVNANFDIVYMPIEQVCEILNKNRDSYIAKKLVELANVIYSSKFHRELMDFDLNSEVSISGGMFEEHIELLYWLLLEDNYKQIKMENVKFSPRHMYEIAALSDMLDL